MSDKFKHIPYTVLHEIAEDIVSLGISPTSLKELSAEYKLTVHTLTQLLEDPVFTKCLDKARERVDVFGSSHLIGGLSRKIISNSLLLLLKDVESGRLEVEELVSVMKVATPFINIDKTNSTSTKSSTSNTVSINLNNTPSETIATLQAEQLLINKERKRLSDLSRGTKQIVDMSLLGEANSRD